MVSKNRKVIMLGGPVGASASADKVIKLRERPSHWQRPYHLPHSKSWRMSGACGRSRQRRCCWKLSGAPAPTPHQHWYHPRTCRLACTACPPELTLKYRRRKRILKTREGICTGGLPARQVKTTPPENRQVVPEKLSVVPQKNAERTGTNIYS